MVFFNWATMQMAAKIVYYGPGLCGKTTNLSYIYAKTAPGSRGEMVSLETETDRTLFFDLLPIEVGKVGGFRTRLQLYTVPGQVFYNTTRKLVLKGVDGLVFVADSQRPMADANAESFKNLEENLREMGLTIDSLPLVLQFNKRDLKNILSVEELNLLINPDGRWENFEAVAVEGHGVFETLKAITKATLKSLRKRMATQETGSVAAAPAAQPAVRPQPALRPAAAPSVSFDPAALRSAAAEGLSAAAELSARRRAARAGGGEEPAEAPVPPTPAQEATAAEVARAPEPPPPEAAPEVLEVQVPAGEPAAPAVEVLDQPIAPAEEVLPQAEEVVPAADEATAPVVAADVAEAAEEPEEAEAAEEPEEAAVEFATTADSAQALAPAEMRHVKVSSSLDILAELETLRKASTMRAEPRPAAAAPAPSFDLDSLLQASVNSRQEVKRKIEERVGGALGRASRCLVNIQLVDSHGKPLREVSPIEVELKRSDRVRQLSMTLVVNLQGD